VMERRHLGSGFCLHPSDPLRKVWRLAWLPSFIYGARPLPSFISLQFGVWSSEFANHLLN
jgi:hypothetical protein